MDAVFFADSVATTVSPMLAEVRSRFAKWRAAKPHRNSRIPDELWTAALSLRAEMSLCAIGKALRLNPSFLAERARQQETRDFSSFDPGALVPATRDGEARFVEIARPHSALPIVSGFPFAARQVVEIRFPDGTTVSATHADPVDVAPLFHSLLATRR